MWKPTTNLKKEFILNIFFKFLYPVWGFPSGSVVENLPPKQETWVQSLGQEARAFMRLHAGIHSFSEAGPGRWAGLGAEGGRTRSFDFVSRAGDCPPPTLHPSGLSPFCALHMTRHEQDCFSSNPGPGLIAWASQAAFLSTTFPAVGTLPSPPAAAQ